MKFIVIITGFICTLLLIAIGVTAQRPVIEILFFTALFVGLLFILLTLTKETFAVSDKPKQAFCPVCQQNTIHIQYKSSNTFKCTQCKVLTGRDVLAIRTENDRREPI